MAAPSHDPTDTSSIGRTLEIIGDRWTMLVLRDAFRGIHRFDEFRRDLGIARPVLSDRLRKLVDAGLMDKVLYERRPPRYEYRLTAMGMELSPALVALMRWGDKYLGGSQGPNTVLVHSSCGTELEQGFWCRACERTFTPSEIGSTPAPRTRVESTQQPDVNPD
ncbi:MAG: winged helix-turn-helix transcriptional regulator [Acidimicrobiia bacterium]